MPKLRTNKTASKRILGMTKKKGQAMILRARRTSAQHLATNKSSRCNHLAAQNINLSKGDAKKIKKMVPYL